MIFWTHLGYISLKINWGQQRETAINTMGGVDVVLLIVDGIKREVRKETSIFWVC